MIALMIWGLIITGIGVKFESEMIFGAGGFVVILSAFFIACDDES